MTLNAEEVRVAITGRVYTAPKGTLLPVDVVTALPVAWTDHGYMTEDGVAIGSAITKYDVKAWQSASPVRSIRLTNAHTLKFKMIQSGKLNTQLAFGGGSWADTTGPPIVSIYTPPAQGMPDDRAVVIEFTDGTITKRWCFADASVTAVGDVVLKSGVELQYDVTMDVVGDVWNIVSNDPADAAAGGGGGGADDAAPARPVKAETPARELAKVAA